MFQQPSHRCGAFPRCEPQASGEVHQTGGNMQLTRYSDYSLRVLMYLAVRPDHLATIEEISDAYGISRAHLMKVVHQLGRAGLLETVRGRGGGMRLAQAPERISIGGVVRRTEDKLALVECFEPKTSECRIES